MKPKLATLQVQKQVLAPLMQQSITVLLLPLAELVATVEQELQANPLLEIAEGAENSQTIAPSKRDDEIRQYLERLTKQRNDEPYNLPEEDFPEEQPVIIEVTLAEHLMRQLRIEISDEAEIKIGELIIGNLNEDGYLKISVEEIAQLASSDIHQVERVLSMIQNFEPIGIAARDIKECILIQLKAKGQDHPFVSEIVNKHLEDIGKKRYAEIARKLEISLNEVQKIAHLISTIEPRPARDYSPISNNIYIKPDVSITHTQEQGYQIQISEEGIPPLRINSSYKAMLNRPNLTEEEKTFIHERLESAMHFIKSIEQRGRTLREITKYILDRQKDFFEGKLFSIAPMTLKDVAAAIGRNESTISRAVNNKYAETPQGIYPLKFFFSQAMPTTENGNTSAQSIKEEIKDLVASEDKFSPLSDQEIQRHFEEKGVLLARRTVAKYREALSIPPSYLRKKVKLN